MASQGAEHQGSYIADALQSDSVNAAETSGKGRKKSQAQMAQGEAKPPCTA